MLVEHCQQSFEQIVDSLTMRIQLPEELREALEVERGASQANPFEMRKAARFRCCGRSVVTIDNDPFVMPGQELKSLAIVRDISRTGIGMISHQQLFPEQLVVVQLENATLKARVARTRRIAHFCYEIGLTIVQHRLDKD